MARATATLDDIAGGSRSRLDDYAVEPVIKAQAVNPLELHVKSIEEGRHYLTPSLSRRLKEVLPAEKFVSDGSDSLEVLLPKLGRLVSKMHSATISSTDTKELRDVFNASRDMIKLIASMQEQVNAEKKLAEIEDAIISACDAIDDEELKERFLDELGRRLNSGEKAGV